MASAVLLKFKALANQSGVLRRPYEFGPWLMPAVAAIGLLEEMTGEPLAVIGADVWAQSGHRLENVADWSCERLAGESADSFARRSQALAIDRLRAAMATDQSSHVDLVVKDAVTSEPLSDLGA
jgi:hypothetical protein